ncbi:hypothetical protein CEE45_16540, partial [Candidatus Heimdallarchaeota archaeon B3_Heim]
NNDLQKILFGLDTLVHKHNATEEFDQEMVLQLMEIVNYSSRNIELVNKIFAVLQSETPGETEQLKVLKLINDAINNFIPSSYLEQIEIQESILSSIVLEADNNLFDVFSELLRFIVSTRSSVLDSDHSDPSILIDASILSSNLCIRIRDTNSQPISELLSTELISTITEKWVSRGHYLPIALASVIMKYYDGSLKITPLDPKGNSFELLFPLKMIIH